MRVVLCQRQIASDGRGGGLGTLYANIAKALAQAGATVTLVTATEPGAVGVDCARISNIHRADPDPAGYSRQVCAVLDGLDFDVAECASWKAELSTYAARPKSARALAVVRGELPAVVLNPQAASIALERALMQDADGVLAVSRTVADLIRRHYGRAVDDVVHNAVDPAIFHPGERSTGGPCRVLWVGSHAPIKRLDALHAIIRRTSDDVAFDIVLPWEQGDVHIERFSTYARVTLHHHVTQARMAALYSQADVLLSTSRLEAFGLGILEAMACGTPVLIPRDIGGAAEFVRDGQDGHYYDSLDEAVARLETEDWRRFGERTVEQARKFSWARCAERSLAAYARILGRRQGA
jgi:D-inositol-3-phosphate glycosyltransferase